VGWYVAQEHLDLVRRSCCGQVAPVDAEALLWQQLVRYLVVEQHVTLLGRMEAAAL
jgi:hypothetical protein